MIESINSLVTPVRRIMILLATVNDSLNYGIIYKIIVIYNNFYAMFMFIHLQEYLMHL